MIRWASFARTPRRAARAIRALGLLVDRAAYTIIMKSQYRQADVDRQRAIEDLEINQKAELKVESPHQKIDLCAKPTLRL